MGKKLVAGSKDEALKDKRGGPDYHTEGVLNTTPPSSSSLVPDAEEASYMNQFRTKIYGCSS